MAEDLVKAYERGMREEDKKSVMVSFRLRPADAAALLGTGAASEAFVVTLSSMARLAALERIETYREMADSERD